MHNIILLYYLLDRQIQKMWMGMVSYIYFIKLSVDGWNGEMSGILCDKSITVRQKGKLYKTVMMTEILYRSECWVVDKKIE